MKLLMLSGLPGSGKSTMAIEMVHGGGEWVRISRDVFRDMFAFKKWSGRNEDTVIKSEKALAITLLSLGKNVIVDDCNLGTKHKDMWRNLALENRATFESVFVNTPVAECITRDVAREKQVGEDVIIQMAMQYGLWAQSTSEVLGEKGIILFDIDGTIADITHRLSYVRQTPKDWKGFFNGISDDEPRAVVLEELMKYYSLGHPIILISARPEDYKKETKAWLNKIFHGEKPYTTLFMRRSGDRRPDFEIKADIYNRYFAGKYYVEKVFDDRPQVIVKTWIPLLGKDKVVDVGTNTAFPDERSELEYWTPNTQYNNV